MITNKIVNFDELNNALEDLIDLSEAIIKTLEKTQIIYEGQSAGWHSRNSSIYSDKMINYSEEAKIIAKNIHEISDVIQKFKNDSHSIDERK